VKGVEEIRYALDFRASNRSAPENPARVHPSPTDNSDSTVPRIARLMALALRFDGLLRADQFRDYAELARLGRVTRARMTQIMKLLDLAPDIQEQILFLPNVKGLTERNLRPIVSRLDWQAQRRMFHKILKGPIQCLPELTDLAPRAYVHRRRDRALRRNGGHRPCKG
jgi:hypothetical protein